VPLLTGCYDANPNVAGPSQFANGDFSQGLTAWFEASGLGCDGAGRSRRRACPVWHVNYRRGNWITIARIARCSLTLPYVYDATIRSTIPIVALYWEAEIADTSRIGAYNDWTTLHTYSSRRTGGQAPFGCLQSRADAGAGEVWIKGLRLSEIKKPPL